VTIRRALRGLSVVAALALISIFFPSSGFSIHRLSAKAVIGVQDMHQGFDRACAPGAGTMSNWWTSSPYWYVGIYIGGSNKSCTNDSNLTSSWISDVNSNGMEWSFVPFYVGLQSQCVFQSGLAEFSNDTTTANSEGSNAADYAISDAESLGFTNSIVYFDLEAFDTSNSTCLAAAEAFVRGWVNELQNRGWTAGLYGSSGASAMDDMYHLSANPTDAMLADYNDSNSPWGISSVPNSDWEYDHRIHQYHVDSTCETHGGICLNVDRNCAIGKTAKAWSVSTETSEPSGSSESDGPSEDVPPCGS